MINASFPNDCFLAGKSDADDELRLDLEITTELRPMVDAALRNDGLIGRCDGRGWTRATSCNRVTAS